MENKNSTGGHWVCSSVGTSGGLGFNAKPDMVFHACNLFTRVMEAGDSEVQDYPWPHNNFERSKPAWDTTKQIDERTNRVDS